MPSFSRREFMTSSESPAMEAIRPGVGVLVEVDGLAQGRVLLGRLEERALDRGRRAVPPAHGLHDGLGIDALVDVQRDGGHLERGVLGLAGPGQRRIEVRVVGVSRLRYVPVGSLGDQPDRRVIPPLLPRVVVLLDRRLRAAGLSPVFRARAMSPPRPEQDRHSRAPLYPMARRG